MKPRAVWPPRLLRVWRQVEVDPDSQELADRLYQHVLSQAQVIARMVDAEADDVLRALLLNVKAQAGGAKR